MKYATEKVADRKITRYAERYVPTGNPLICEYCGESILFVRESSRAVAYFRHIDHRKCRKTTCEMRDSTVREVKFPVYFRKKDGAYTLIVGLPSLPDETMAVLRADGFSEIVVRTFSGAEIFADAISGLERNESSGESHLTFTKIPSPNERCKLLLRRGDGSEVFASEYIPGWPSIAFFDFSEGAYQVFGLNDPQKKQKKVTVLPEGTRPPKGSRKSGEFQTVGMAQYIVYELDSAYRELPQAEARCLVRNKYQKYQRTGINKYRR